MRKRWFASSTLARAVAASLALATLAIAPPLALAEDTPVASPSPAVEGDFLLLPSYDLTRIDPTGKSRIGDLIELKIAGFVPQANEKGEILPYSVESAPGAKPLEDQGWDVFPLRSSKTELKLSVAALKKGTLTLESIVISDGTKPVGRTNPFILEIQSSIRPGDPEPTKPADLRPPAGLPFPVWIAVLGGVIALILVTGLAYGIVRLVQRSKPEPPPAPPAPPKPEDVVAIAALDALERQALWLKQQYKPHYFGISEILKTYFGSRFGFDARESTTRELIRSLEGLKVADRLIDRIESLYGRLDLVKFTDHQPLPDEARELLETARALVLETRKPPAPAPVPERQAT